MQYFAQCICAKFMSEINYFHISSKSLAQPDMRPVSLSNHITEPLVCNLMSDKLYSFSCSGNRIFKIKNGACIFHSPEHCLGLNIRQLAIGIRANIIYEEWK